MTEEELNRIENRLSTDLIAEPYKILRYVTYARTDVPALIAEVRRLLESEREFDELYQAQRNKLNCLEKHECCCSYDDQDAMCVYHSPKLVAALDEIKSLQARVYETPPGEYSPDGWTWKQAYENNVAMTVQLLHDLRSEAKSDQEHSHT